MATTDAAERVPVWHPASDSTPESSAYVSYVSGGGNGLIGSIVGAVAHKDESVVCWCYVPISGSAAACAEWSGWARTRWSSMNEVLQLVQMPCSRCVGLSTSLGGKLHCVFRSQTLRTRSLQACISHSITLLICIIHVGLVGRQPRIFRHPLDSLQSFAMNVVNRTTWHLQCTILWVNIHRVVLNFMKYVDESQMRAQTVRWHLESSIVMKSCKTTTTSKG